MCSVNFICKRRFMTFISDPTVFEKESFDCNNCYSFCLLKQKQFCLLCYLGKSLFLILHLEFRGKTQFLFVNYSALLSQKRISQTSVDSGLQPFGLQVQTLNWASSALGRPEARVQLRLLKYVLWLHKLLELLGISMDILT